MTSTNISSDAGNSRTFFVNFNQDCTSIAVGSHTGYRLYSLSGGVDLLNQITAVTDDADICIVERLFGSSLVAVVSLTAPRKLKVCHFKKRSEICNYSYSNTILAVKLNRARLVVCLEESLYIHNIRDMKVLHTIRDTPPNPQGLCALSINNDSCYLAYPGSNTIGEVQIFDATNLQAKIMIQAHDSPLAAIAFNPTGGRIATASERGTVIRVFSVADGAKLYEFRRGMKRCVAISCLAFSTCGQYLATSSNTETVHVFKLELPGDIPRKSVDETGWIGFLSSYLPAQVTDVLNQGRAAMAAHLPVCGVKNVVGITTIQNQLRLLVACENGYLYVYNLDNNDAGDLVLLKQHRLDGVPDESAQQAKDKPDGRSDAQAITAKGEGSTGNSVLLALCSYAGVLKGNPADRMSGTESDKLREMAQATATPSLTEGGATLFLGDDAEYPPLTQRAD